MRSVPKKAQMRGTDIIKGFCAPDFTSKYVIAVTGANCKYEYHPDSSTVKSGTDQDFPNLRTPSLSSPSSSIASYPLSRHSTCLLPFTQSFFCDSHFRGIEDAVFDSLDSSTTFSSSIKNCPTIVANSINMKEIASSKVRRDKKAIWKERLLDTICTYYTSNIVSHIFPAGIFHACVFDSQPPFPSDP